MRAKGPEMYALVNRFVDYVRWLYMQYLLNTSLYMLEPFEVRLFNLVVMLILVTWAYSAYVFLPGQLTRIVEWFLTNGHPLGGQPSTPAATVNS